MEGSMYVICVDCDEDIMTCPCGREDGETMASEEKNERTWTDQPDEIEGRKSRIAVQLGRRKSTKRGAHPDTRLETAPPLRELAKKMIAEGSAFWRETGDPTRVAVCAWGDLELVRVWFGDLYLLSTGDAGAEVHNLRDDAELLHLLRERHPDVFGCEAY